MGSRRRNTLKDRRQVFTLLDQLVEEHGTALVVVSGGCKKGADAFAKEYCRLHGVAYKEHPVDTEGVRHRGEFRDRAFARNRDIAEDSDQLFCWVSLPDRTGGTENTVGHGLDLKREVFLVDDRGRVYLSPDGQFPPCDPVRLLCG